MAQVKINKYQPDKRFNKGDRVKIDPESRMYRQVNKPDRHGTITSDPKPYNPEIVTVLWDGTKTKYRYYCNYLVKVGDIAND